MFNDIILSRIKDYDDNCRDDNNDIPIKSDEKKKQFIDNIINTISIEKNDDYIKFTTKVNEKFYMKNLPFESIEPSKLFYRKYKHREIKGNYVKSFINNKQIDGWDYHNNIFIMAGTGKGKNTFIQDLILNKNKKVVIFLNRNSLYKQQIISIIKKLQQRDDNDADKIYLNFESKGITYLNNIMFITYQCASSNIFSKKTSKFFSKAKYVIFDEIHYILDDANFSKGTNSILDMIIKEIKNSYFKYFHDATKIYMSATMEETLLLLYLKGLILNNFSWYLSFTPKFRFLENKFEDYNNRIYYIPTNYNYVIPYCYSNYRDIVEQIMKSNEKWLIFVNSIPAGDKLKEQMPKNKTVRFIHAKNKDIDENIQTLQSIYDNDMMDCDVLIATSVLYNGINFNNKDLKNIVLPLTTIQIAKQIIGRRRVEKNENINVYFYNASEEEIYNLFSDQINEYFKIKKVLKSDNSDNSAALNETYINYPVEYLYVYKTITGVKIGLNETAAYKVHFDAMFYLYILKKFSMQKKFNPHYNSSPYVNSILQHLGIKYKINDIQNITILNEEQRTERARNAMITLIKEYLQPQIDKKINGKFKTIIELQTKVNEIYKDFSGKNISIHFQTKTRSLPPEDINDVLSELNVVEVYMNAVLECTIRYYFKAINQDKSTCNV